MVISTQTLHVGPVGLQSSVTFWAHDMIDMLSCLHDIERLAVLAQRKPCELQGSQLLPPRFLYF
jgi:hypothetical protein